MKRIVIVVEEGTGVIARISRVLADNDINIETLDADSHGAHGLIVLSTDQSDEALRVLRRESFKAVIDDALIIQLRDEPGALARVAERLSNTGIRIRSIHILSRRGNYSTVALSVDDRAKARELITENIVA